MPIPARPRSCRASGSSSTRADIRHTASSPPSACSQGTSVGPEMSGSPAQWIDQIAAPFPGVSYATLQRAGGRLMPEDTPRVPWSDGTFKTASGRFVFPERFDDDPVIAPDGYLHLVFLATEHAINSQITGERQRDLASVRVHPRTASAHGVADADEVTLESARGGRLNVRVTLDEATREDT